MEDRRNYIQKIIDERISRVADERSEQFVRKYARHADGSPNPALAECIEREVRRRSAISKELDIYEPLRWAGYSFLLSVAAGVGIKMTTEKSFSRPALLTLLLTTGLNSAIQIARIYPRYESALRGGKDTAMTMYAMSEENCLTNNEQFPSLWSQRASAPPAALEAPFLS